MTITEFLLARIADQIADCREVQALAVTRGIDTEDPREPSLRVARSLLAECEAKRRIVEEHSVTRNWIDVRGFDQPDYREPEDSCRTCGWVPTDSGCPTLRILASIYADHPGYRQEWRVL